MMHLVCGLNPYVRNVIPALHNECTLLQKYGQRLSPPHCSLGTLRLSWPPSQLIHPLTAKRPSLTKAAES
eukprot:360488-Chlamydomonas_euryale.AAC.5